MNLSAGTLLGLLGLVTYPQLVSNRRFKYNAQLGDKRMLD